MDLHPLRRRSRASGTLNPCAVMTPPEGATAAGQRISLYGYRQVRSEPEIGQWPEFE